MGLELNVDEGARKCTRLLLLSYACSPYRGSEPGVGWNRAYETAKHFDTWVICKKQKYEDDIKRYFSEHGDIPTLHICFVSRTRMEKIIKSIPGLFYVAYNIWQRRAYKLAVQLHRQLQFDLVHHVNFNCFREPGYCWKLNVPFIWGPVGGTENYPRRFLWKAGIRGAICEGLRNIINIIQFRFSIRVRKALKRSAVLLTINRNGLHAWSKIHRIKPVLMQDVGIDSISQTEHQRKSRKGPLRIFWGAVMKHRKALHLLILALNMLPPDVPYKVKIAGRGPLEKRWRRQAKRMGVEKNCEWLGWLSLPELQQVFLWADVFVFTGLRNATNTMVLQALSLGVPVVCLDLQGVGDLVTSECGMKIPVTNLREVIKGLRDSLIVLAKNREHLEALSRGALERAREFLWSRKIKQTVEIYQQVLTAQGKYDIKLPEG